MSQEQGITSTSNLGETSDDGGIGNHMHKLDATDTLTFSEFDQDLCRKKLVLMIVMDELPFTHVEGEGFIEFVHSLQPEFNIPSALTISMDILQLYSAEREKLREFFKTSGVTVCLTADTWTSEEEINYMCLTAHYIDNDWTLHKKMIFFSPVDSRNGEEIGRQICVCLRDWGIARVFAITVDDSSSNIDTCLNFMKGRLTSKGCDVLKGEHLHMRCTTHVVNLIVGDGLKVINQSIQRVRDAVRFVKQSRSRLATFRECCEDEAVESKSLLYLDVPGRWNTTCLMLTVALKFEKAFERLEVKDPFFKDELTDGVPTPADWEVVKAMAEILVVFHELTLKVSASVHVTSHLAYHEIDMVGNMLREYVDSSNPDIKEMALIMQLNYEKFWGGPKKMNKLIYMALVVDPRYKFEFIDYLLREEYGDVEGPKLALDVRSVLDNLYRHYRALHRPKSQSDVVSPPLKKIKYSRIDRYRQQMEESRGNDLDIYLKEKNLLNEKDDFDILKWWDVQQCRFPILSHLARDILSMPVSAVPSKSGFSTEGRVLDPFRSSLSIELVQALVCTQDWFKCPEKSTTIEEELASLEKDDEGCNEKGDSQ